jgi:hypothetical protein
MSLKIDALSHRLVSMLELEFLSRSGSVSKLFDRVDFRFLVEAVPTFAKGGEASIFSPGRATVREQVVVCFGGFRHLVLLAFPVNLADHRRQPLSL